jgi:hypothetical protein
MAFLSTDCGFRYIYSDMTPIALSHDALREVMAAAALVPVQCRIVFLERVAQELQRQRVIGAGIAHRISYRVAKELAWDAEQEAS